VQIRIFSRALIFEPKITVELKSSWVCQAQHIASAHQTSTFSFLVASTGNA
jgi:hypothetical protein